MQKKHIFLALTLFLTCFNVGLSQNIGVGTSTPVEKLHVAGTFRVDDLQTALAASAATDKMVWVDANGKVYSFPAGTPGKVLGVNGTGILAWLDQGMSTTLNNGQIWIGNAANTAQPQTLSGDAIVSNTGVVTIQDNAVDGTDITISGESNGSLMYFNGTDWVNLGIGTPGQVLTISGGVPAWVSLPAAPTTGNLTTTTSGVTVTGGTGAVLGAGATVNVATNALNQNGLVTGPTAANALQAWGTDALGNPGWVPVSSLLPANDVIAGAGNNAVSITSGTNQVIGASDVTINVATNALSQDGVVTGTTAANVNDVWGTNGAGVPAWRDPNSLLTTNDVVSSNTAINITNGIGQVVGGANLTIAAQMNALNQNGFVPGPTAANANQVWVTNGAGVPAWQNANNAIIKNDLLAGVANNAVSITNGTGQIVGGLNATVNVATNALNQAGVVTGTTAANANQVWGTNGLGVPGWITPANNDWHITGNAGTAPATNFIGTTDNVDFVARTNNIERMRINNNGRVGINTASTGIGSTYPWAHIEIVGDGNTNGDILFKSVGPVTDYLTWQTAGGTFPTPAIVNNSQIIGYINWQAHNGTGFSTTAYETIFIEGAATAASLPTAINFATTPSGSTIPLERLRITNSGNIGIGTTVPDASALLQVTATNKGVILPNVALSATNTAGPITLPATTLMVYNTATAGAGATAVTPGYYYNAGTGAAPNWRRLAEGTTGWNITGNYLTGNGVFGTLSNNLIDFYSNNIFRGRISNTDGEFSWGATASPYAGDALCGVGTAALSFAVNGYSAFNGSGTWGEVLAASTTAFSAVQGVYGGSGAGAGVLGNYNGTNTSNTRAGVVGILSTPAAAAGGAGVYGYNSIASGNQRMGVLGNYNGAAFGIGAYGIGFGGGIIAGNFDIGVVGWRANNSNYSGYFNGNHVIANGTKTASVPTSKGNQLLYVMESPEVWFEDFGTANLVNGVAKVKLDEMFLETVLIDEEHPIHVFVQVNGECEDVYVVKGMDGFTVKEKNNGKSNVEFSYRIVAKRLHFPDHRFGNDPVWGPGDTHKYSQRAPKRPIDYDEMVKQDMEAKKNWKPTPMPEGFQYLNTPDYKPELETQRPASSMKTVEPNPGPVPVSLPESIQDTRLAPADSGVKPDMSAKRMK